MPIDQLGKLLFPRLQPWQRERKVKTIIVVVVFALIAAGMIGGFMFLRNSRPL
jgi:nitrate reductase NapE component